MKQKRKTNTSKNSITSLIFGDSISAGSASHPIAGINTTSITTKGTHVLNPSSYPSNGTTTTITTPYYGGAVYGNWTTTSELHIGGGKLMEENGDLIWVRPNGSKFNLTGKEAMFDQLYEKMTTAAPSCEDKSSSKKRKNV